MLEFGGSEGGLHGQLLGSALASAGYPTLDIAYFGEPGLPSELRDIPLEYFARALRWLARQPGVLAGQTYVSGASRGSEAALLLGVYYPGLVHGVIASSPNDVALCSYPGCQGAAWTLDGKPLPYARQVDEPYPTDTPAAVIPVEKIRGPVFLDCGTADRVWTSCAFAQAIQRRLNAARDRYPHVLYRYQGAGHGTGDLTPTNRSHPAPPTWMEIARRRSAGQHRCHGSALAAAARLPRLSRRAHGNLDRSRQPAAAEPGEPTSRLAAFPGSLVAFPGSHGARESSRVRSTTMDFCL